MLLKLLAHYNADATFVIQALNPYFYDDLNDMKPIIDSIKFNVLMTTHHKKTLKTT